MRGIEVEWVDIWKYRLYMEQKLGVYVCKYYSENIQQLLIYLKYKGSVREVDALWNEADVWNGCVMVMEWVDIWNYRLYMEYSLDRYMCGDYSDNIQQLLTYLKYRESA